MNQLGNKAQGTQGLEAGVRRHSPESYSDYRGEGHGLLSSGGDGKSKVFNFLRSATMTSGFSLVAISATVLRAGSLSLATRLKRAHAQESPKSESP